MDASRVLVVEILTKKQFAIDKLHQTENGGVEVQGRIFGPKVGLYAARIGYYMPDKKYKEVATAAGEHMRVDPEKPGEKYRTFDITFKPINEEVFNTPDP